MWDENKIDKFSLFLFYFFTLPYLIESEREGGMRPATRAARHRANRSDSRRNNEKFTLRLLSLSPIDHVQTGLL